MPRPVQRFLKRWYYPRLLRAYSEANWPEAPVVRKLVQRGDHVVDAGANIGYISMLLSKMVGPEGVVHSFEPVPVTFDLLAHNLAALRIGNVRARRLAVSDAPGHARMTTPDYKDGGENLYESHLVNGPGGEGTFEVELARMDDALGADCPRVTFLKIDVEGHELAAIRGAGWLLGVKPALLIEVSGDPDESGSGAAQLFEWLAARGYGAFWLREGKLSRRQHGDRSVDYFFLTDEHVRSKLAGMFYV